jgi:hypothetical protein
VGPNVHRRRRLVAAAFVANHQPRSRSHSDTIARTTSACTWHGLNAASPRSIGRAGDARHVVGRVQSSLVELGTPTARRRRTWFGRARAARRGRVGRRPPVARGKAPGPGQPKPRHPTRGWGTGGNR